MEEGHYMFLSSWMLLQLQMRNSSVSTLVSLCEYISGETCQLMTVLKQNLCLYADEHTLVQLLEYIPNVDKTFQNGNTLLHWICKSDISPSHKAKTVIKRDQTLINTQNRSGLSPLHIASLNKKTELISELLQSNDIDVNIASNNKQTPLHVCACYGMDEHIRILLRHETIKLDAIDFNGNTPLHHAAMHQQLTAYNILRKDDRYDQNRRNKRGNTPQDELHYHVKECALLKAISEFENIMEYDDSIEFCDRKRNNVLHLCCSSSVDGLQKVTYLVSKDKKLLRQRNSASNLPIHIAARNKDKRILEYLLSHDSCVHLNATGFRDMTPLHIAAFNGLSENVDALLTDMFISINARDSEDNTPLHTASMKGHYEVIRRLKCIPWCDICARNSYDKTADDLMTPSSRIVQAIYEDSLNCLANALAKDALPEPTGESILHVCAKSKSCAKEKAQLIISKDRTLLTKCDSNGFLPIHIAAKYNNVHVLEYLAKEGTLNHKTSSQQTAFHIAAENCNIESVKLLLQCPKLEINSKDVKGNTTAHIAAERDFVDILHEIEKSSNYIRNITNTSGKMPYDLCPTISCLKMLCFNGSAKSMQSILRTKGELLAKVFENALFDIILKTKVDRITKLRIVSDLFPTILCKVDYAGNTLLHLAVIDGDVSLLRMCLASRHSDQMIEASNINFQTPLHIAAIYGQEDCAYMLLQSYASVNAEDIDKRTPIHFAAMGNFINVLKMVIFEPSADINVKDVFGKYPWHYMDQESDCRNMIEAHQDFDYTCHQTTIEEYEFEWEEYEFECLTSQSENVTKWDKKYDVFVFYCTRSVERNLVKYRLRPYLEKTGYSVYTEEKDMLMGTDIIDNYIEAIRASDHITLLISPECIQDPDFDFILRCCVSKVVDEGSRIVSIINGSIEDFKQKLSPALKLFESLESATFLQWPQEDEPKQMSRFWTQLISMLPKQKL